ncbi:MAG: ATP-binding protein [Kofleriaceae bacterium]
MPTSVQTELHGTLTRLIRACDVVFGTASTLLAVIATWRVAIGDAPLGIAIALWLVPAINIGFSLATKHVDRVIADGVRGVMCAPLAAYCYVEDHAGFLHHLWLPALMLSVAVETTMCIGQRRARAGIGIACLYASVIALASYASEHLDPNWVHDVFGILIIGTIISVVAAYLGEALELATQQRTRAEEALASLHEEMERRVALEKELLQSQKLESVGRLAAGIAHEINTPVQYVGDSLHFISDAVDELFDTTNRSQDDVDYLREEVPKALALAETGLERVVTIVRSMKVFAHPDESSKQATDLNRALASTLVLATNEYKYVADLVTEWADIPFVRCFASEINQVVLNMVVNSAHAIEEAFARTQQRGTLFVGTRLAGDRVVITVRDTGSGIPVAIRDRIFDPFFTTKEVGKGTGQGLSIARQIVVDKHGGTVTFESEEGVGTTFFISLPIAGNDQSGGLAMVAPPKPHVVGESYGQ